jgi:hypothetical protein
MRAHDYEFVLDRKTNFVLLHIIMRRCIDLVRKLIVTIDGKLEKEMSEYPEADWAEITKKAIREYICCREICKIYCAPIERAMSQEK